MKTLSWDEFRQGIANLNNEVEELTDIKCPECGELIYKINNMVFTSYPPKYKYICKNCGWKDFA